jgi:hypothetical protein
LFLDRLWVRGKDTADAETTLLECEAEWQSADPVAVEPGVDVDQIDAVVRQFGQLLEAATAAVDDSAADQR